jgi:hypothetical protein
MFFLEITVKYFLTVLTFLVVCTSVGSAYAFKVDTHVWIGQQVIEDLYDGYLTFDLNGKKVDIKITDEVKNIILNNQAYYRMGNIGPDASPDIVSGQTVVHPGSDKNWETDDWLTWINNKAKNYGPQERAYAYGFNAHAAADMFAHTYVNTYSGGIFDLPDDDINVEKRHIILEAFISNYAPKMTGLELALPTDFLRKEMVMNATVASQYSETGSAPYLAKMYRLRQELQNILDSQELKDIEEELIKQGISSATGIRIPDDLAADINKTWQDIDKLSDRSINEAQRLADKQNQNLNRLLKYQNNLQITTLSAAQSSLEKVVRFDANTLTTVIKLELQINDLKNRIGDKIEEKVCDRWYSVILGGGCAAYETIKKWADWQNDLWREIDGLNQKIADEKSRAIRQTIGELKNVSTSTNQITRDVINTNHQITQNIVDFSQRFNGNPLRGFISGWRDDIDRSVGEFVFANAETMKLTMVADGNPSQPIRTWFDCSAPSLLGVPAEIPDTKCKVKSLVGDLNKYLQNLQETALKSTPVGRKVAELEAKIKEKVIAERDRLTTRLLESILPPEVKEIIELFSKSPSDAAVNEIFFKGGNDFHLLRIPDMVNRVRAEMHLRPNNTFDPQKYVVVKNAIVMAKLALLNAVQLNDLAYAAGVPMQTAYGNALYYGNDHVFTRSIRSIDGNHQWLEYAPPYPRQPAYPDKEIHQYGYGLNQNLNEGFRIWQDQGAQKLVFKKLFVGPIAPGIEAPEMIGMPAVLPPEYPYESCYANPFPSGVGDRTCTLIKILPAILLLTMN